MQKSNLVKTSEASDRHRCSSLLPAELYTSV